MKQKQIIKNHFLLAQKAIEEAYTKCQEMARKGYKLQDAVALDRMTELSTCRTNALMGLMTGTPPPRTGE